MRVAGIGAVLAAVVVPLATAEAPSSSPPAVQVSVKADFINTELGLRLVNGVATHTNLTFFNAGPDPVVLRKIVGSLHEPGSQKIVRNLTAVAPDTSIQPGLPTTVDFNFKTEMMPQDVYLNLYAVLASPDGSLDQLLAFNGTGAIVEAPIHIFDPQMMFLYVFLAGFTGLSAYYVYSSWVLPSLPAKKKKRAPPREDLVSVLKATKPDMNWIPESIKNPKAPTKRRLRK